MKTTKCALKSINHISHLLSQIVFLLFRALCHMLCAFSSLQSAETEELCINITTPLWLGHNLTSLQDSIPSQWQGFCLTLLPSLSTEINYNTLKHLVDSQDHTIRKLTHQQLPGVPNREKHPFPNPPLILANQRLPTYFAILHFFI